jgi:transposase
MSALLPMQTSSPMPAHIWLAIEAVDMRIGIDGLATRVLQTLGKSPSDGSAFVFRNRRANRIKLLIWDATGVWLCQRRLHQGSFVWPDRDTGICELSAAQWNYLITGVDWERLLPSTPLKDPPVFAF